MQKINRRTMMTLAGAPLVARAAGWASAGSTFVQHNNALSIHGQAPNNYQTSAEMIEKIANAKIVTVPSNTNITDLASRSNRKLPGEIPPGDTGIEFGFALGGFDPGEPVFGDYVVRHNLNPSTYTLNFTGMSRGVTSTVDINGATYTRISVNNIQSQNVGFTVSGPSGPLPADWDIQFLRISDEAAFDDNSKPVWHATRYFIPEFLARLTEWKPEHFRFMKSLRTEVSIYNTLDEFPAMTDRYMRVTYPIEMCVGLCNYIGMGGWFNFPMVAGDDLIDYWCDFIIANMDPHLQVLMGHGNEHWNIGYSTVRGFYGWEGVSRFGSKGAGTISYDKATGVVTRGAGAPDLTTMFGAGLTDNIAFGGMSYPIKINTVTADNMQVWPWWPDGLQSDAIDADYYYNPGSSNIMNGHGYMVRSTLAMKRVTDKFETANQMYRLVRMYEAQLANLGSKTPLTNASNYWTTSDYIDPLTVHDAIAINPYFGDGYLKKTDFKAAVRAAADAGDQATYNQHMRNYTLGIPIDGVVTSTRTIPGFITERMKNWRVFCDENNLKLYGYEGGHHIIHDAALTVPDDNNIIDMWRAWLHSSEAQTVYEAWRDAQIPYLDGPIMKFQFFSTTSKFGSYGMFEGYTQNETSNKELSVVEGIRQMKPYWLPDYPPVAVSVPLQTWAAGVDPAFNLSDYTSVNATSFAGTPPPGMSLDSATGRVTGTPAAGSGSYDFTATNASGSVSIPVNIVVI